MRALYLHCKTFSYLPIQPVGEIPKDEAQKRSYEFNDSLVVFLTIEKNDWERRNTIIENFLEDILQKLSTLKIKKVIIYPYAHLSDNLAEPRKALRFLKILDKALKEKKVDYHRAPFGWYKEFKIHIHGHPLAESSRKF